MGQTIRTAVDQALAATELTDSDTAAVALARKYADQIDAGGELSRLGPQLLSTLTALGMTPAGRAAVLGKGGNSEPTRTSPLDELRERRRKRNATNLDATA